MGSLFVSTFLLEIGTEELPADFASAVLDQFQNMVKRDLGNRRFTHGEIYCTSTPRRIALFIRDLATKGEDFEEYKKGPPASNAFKDGKATNAAKGFAKKYGVDLTKLEVRETTKGDFVFVKVVEKGEDVNTFLSTFVPEWIASLQGKRFMRWGSSDRKFSRPIRWIVSMLNNQIIPISLDDTDPKVISGNVSRGHRLFAETILVENASNYMEILGSVGIEVDRNKRKSFIKSLVKDSSRLLKASPDLSVNLLNELTDLVESPTLIKGKIEDNFLELPAEVLSTVMKVHQRYIPLFLNNASNDPLSLDAKNVLLPRFLCICNGLPSSLETIRKGNEMVLRARLSDAEFFVKSDLSISSEERTSQLEKVSFADGLGSLLNRVKRIEWIVDLLLEKIDINEKNKEYAKEASGLCKHDLVSHMVGEFPELQGVIGGKYLLAEGKSREVALAVLEHYLPKGQGDNLPKSDAGSILALAERIELLLSIFSKGERPSGSSDPYALRRAGNGILQILWAKCWHLNLYDLLEKSSLYWAQILPELKIESDALFNELIEFMRQRILSLLEESDLDVDIVLSVAGDKHGIKRLLVDPFDAKSRADLLRSMRKSGQLQEVHSVVTRATRLSEKGDLPKDIYFSSNVINQDLFEKSSEHQFLSIIKSIEPLISDTSFERYKQIANILCSGSKVLEEFFDGEDSVMVMVEDVSIRENRLNLLSLLRNQSLILADFNKIKSIR